MTLKDIKNMWQKKETDSAASVALWDTKAPAFAYKEPPSSKNNLTMQLIEDNNMITDGCSVLDVGCGGGRFSFTLEKMGASVRGIDFSSKMIEECEKAKKRNNSRVEFEVCDWENVDLKKEGTEGKYDLVLANMTPAVCSAETFMKLSQASKNWCIFVKHTRRTREVFDKLCDHLEIDNNIASDDALAYAFCLLWKMGYKPKLAYKDEIWESDMSLDDITKEYIIRLEMKKKLTDEEKRETVRFLTSLSSEGKLKEVTNTTIAAIYWQVK